MTVSNLIAAFIAYGLDASKPGSPSVGTNASYYYATDTGKLYCWTGSGWTAVSGGGTGAANPSATAGPTAVNGSATTFMRSDGAPAVQLGSNSQKGLVQVDGTTITASSGIISAVPATLANPTATASDIAVNGVATTYMRSDAAPAVQKTSSTLFGLAKVDNTTITATGGVISASASGIGVPNGANPTATANDTAVNGVATTYMRSDGAPAIQKTSSSVFGLAKVDNTTITAAGGVITANGTALITNADTDLNLMFFGTGIDGDLTSSSGTTNLTRDMFYGNVTLSGTAKLNLNGWRVYISGTLDLTNAPIGAVVSVNNLAVSLNGGAGSAVGNAGTGGASLSTTNTLGKGQGGGAGGNGATGAGAQAANVVNGGNALPNTPGTGGKGGNTGSAGGAARAGNTGAQPLDIRKLTDQLFTWQNGTINYIIGGVGAPGGGGGAGDGVGAGGGGGGGGATPGVVWISAQTIARSSSTTTAAAINADAGNGGNGGSPSGGTNAGGGGGGGGAPGGWAMVIYRNLSGTSKTGLISAAGGNGGNGGTGRGTGIGGDGGASGSRGRIDLYCLATGSWTHAETDTTTVAGTAGSGATAGTGGTANSQSVTL